MWEALWEEDDFVPLCPHIAEKKYIIEMKEWIDFISLPCIF